MACIIPFRSPIEALYTLNSPALVSFNLTPKLQPTLNSETALLRWVGLTSIALKGDAVLRRLDEQRHEAWAEQGIGEWTKGAFRVIVLQTHTHMEKHGNVREACKPVSQQPISRWSHDTITTWHMYNVHADDMLVHASLQQNMQAARTHRLKMRWRLP